MAEEVKDVGPGSSTRSILLALLSSLGFLLLVANLPAHRPASTPTTTLPGLPPAQALSSSP